MRRLLTLIVAGLAGLLLAGAYEPVNIWFLAPLAIAILVAIQWDAKNIDGFLTGLVFGFVSFFVQHMWLRVVGADAQLVLSIYLAVWIAFVGLGTAFLSRNLPKWIALIGITGLWVLEEALRGRYPFGGYPWARIVFSQSDGLLAQWSTLLGVPAVTAMVVLIATSTAIALRYRTRQTIAVAIVVILVSISIPRLITTNTTSENNLTIAVVQGGTPQTGLGAMDVRKAVLENHARVTVELADQVRKGEAKPPDLVLWPENSSDLNPFQDVEAQTIISRASQAIDAPILVGAVVDSFTDPDNEVYNMGILWDPKTGPGDTYIKNAPVPFGEFIPFRSLLTSLISRYERVPRDFAHGQDPGIFTVNGITLGDLICFEVAVDKVVNRVIDEGAGALVVQTNNATYANSALPAQQLAIEKMRAIEMGRAVVVAATTGISAFIDPNGNVEQILADGEVGAFVVDVPSITDRTIGSFLGPLVEIFLCLVALALLVVAWTRRRTNPQVRL